MPQERTGGHGWGGAGLDLADQCLHSAEADVRSPRRESGFDPQPDLSDLVKAQARV